MITVRVMEVENVGGHRYTYDRYYNVSDDTEITQLMHICNVSLSDEECQILTDENWENFKRKLEIDFPDTPQIEEYERQANEEEDDILSSYVEMEEVEESAELPRHDEKMADSFRQSLSKVFTVALATEKELSNALHFVALSPHRIPGYTGMELEVQLDGEDFFTRIGWWEEGKSLFDSIFPEYREEVLPDDPAYQAYINM